MNMTQLLSQFWRFVLVGALSTVTTILVLVLLVEVFQVLVIPASVVGYVAGGVLNYLLNYRITFRSDRSHRTAALKHATVIGLGLLVNTSIMHVGVNRIGLHYLTTQVLAVAFVLAISFMLSRHWTFSR